MAIDIGKGTAKGFLDLSAAFDMVDHKFHLKPWKICSGCQGQYLDRFNHTFNQVHSECVKDNYFKPISLQHNILQESCNSPQCFQFYIAFITDIEKNQFQSLPLVTTMKSPTTSKPTILEHWNHLMHLNKLYDK